MLSVYDTKSMVYEKEKRAKGSRQPVNGRYQGPIYHHARRYFEWQRRQVFSSDMILLPDGHWTIVITSVCSRLLF